MKIPKPTRELAPEGTHRGRCINIVDLGTQPASQADWEDQRKVTLGFHLVGLKTKDGKNIVVYRTYGFTGGPKANLTKDIKAWLNQNSNDIDLDECLEQDALITISHKESNGGVYANITNISAPLKGSKPLVSNENVFSLYLDDSFDEDVFNTLPEHIQTKIVNSPEYEDLQNSRKPKARKPVARQAAAPPARTGKAPAKTAKSGKR